MNKNSKTKQQLLLEMEELRTRLDATERRFQEANEILQAQIAERKRAEETFQKAQEYTESIVETIREPLLVLASDLRVLSANRSFYDTFKVTPKETTGNLIYNLGNRQWDIPRLRTLLEDILTKNNKFDNYEVEHVFSNIGHKTMLLNARRIVQKEIGSQMILVAIEDITERRQLEILLSESEERYRRLFETANDGILLLEKSEGNITHANPAVTAMLGYSKEECIGNKLQDIGFSHDMGDFQKIMHTLDRSGIIYYDDVPINNRAGQTFYVDVYMVDRARLVQCNIRDITERKQAEETLRQSEERYRMAIESSNDGVAINKGDVHLYVNQRFAEIFGYKNPQEIIGKPYTITVHPDDIETVKEISLKRQQGETVPSRYEFKGIRKNGQEIYIEASSAKTTYNGEPVALTYVRDVTERKKAEQEMLALQEQLRQSQKMEAIGQLAGGIAHDFNNLLTVIQGNAHLSLLDLEERDPLRVNIEEIREASKKAADLTRQLLAFSRKQILEMRVLNLNQVLQRIDKMLRRVIGEDIELAMFLPDFIWKVKVDPGQIEQVIITLSVNARDAMPNGGKLTIETANLELDKENADKHIAVQPGRYVMLSMSDTGVGMTPEVKERIFEPFFTTKEKGKGTGLGLSTVYGIVKQSGGNIWVYSEPGRGTTFKIYLPQVDEPLEELREEAIKEISRGHETILIVEDEGAVRKLAVRFLRKQGYKVLEAPDGGKALMLCEEFKEPIDLILTDVVMPRMSGRKLVDRLKVIHPEMKILYMSGYTDDAILLQGILEPGINSIQKPFAVEGLARKVREILDKKG